MSRRRWKSVCSLGAAAFLILSRVAGGAACCATGAAVPGLIAGDDRAQLTAALGVTGISADVRPDGSLRERAEGDSEWRQGMTMTGAALLSDRWQAGLSIPVVRRSRTLGSLSADGFGLGDVSVQVAFEALPEWTYSAWRPRAFVFATLRLPTGTAAFESRQPFAVDVSGRGYWEPGAGVLLIKIWPRWDALLSVSARYPLPRATEVTGARMRFVPGWGADAGAGLGFSPGGGALRLGAMVLYRYDGSLHTEGLLAQPAPDQQETLFQLQASYLVSPDVSLSLIYSDNHGMPGTRNVPLNRSLMASLQKRWPR